MRTFRQLARSGAAETTFRQEHSFVGKPPLTTGRLRCDSNLTGSPSLASVRPWLIAPHRLPQASMASVPNPLHVVTGAGRPTKIRLAAFRAQAVQIMKKSKALEAESDETLQDIAKELRWRAKSGEPLDQMVLDAFALVREASRRVLGMQHYAVQLMGGLAIYQNQVAEMATGEGKTLTATCPVFLRALPGSGVHVVTTNDYLAQRDAQEMGPVYRMLGLSVGCIQTEMEDAERRQEYSQDITYGTAKEFGFDFLRDRIKKGAQPQKAPWRRYAEHQHPGAEDPVQRGHYFALVDEADSVLIDDAMTPLIIGFPRTNQLAYASLLKWADQAVASGQLERWVDYIYEENRRSASLTDSGCRKVLFLPKPSWLRSFDAERIYVAAEKALVAHLAYKRDRDYIIHEGEIVIVDESTGRPMEGRKWQEGLHQAIEAKESVTVTEETVSAAQVTVQTYFRTYEHLGGMTGTAWQARRELKRVYKLKTTPIPTNRPCIRKGKPPRVFSKMEAKFEAIAAEIERLHEEGRPILVGTPSVRDSEWVSRLLSERGVPHSVINARSPEGEADIVKHAGEPGRITVATNMAGRGTDIKLVDETREYGGLHVIATALHSSLRIDRQLIGRSARQGDPGSYQFFLSLEDDLLQALAEWRVLYLDRSLSKMKSREIARSKVRMFRSAQRKLEKLFHKQRKDTLKAEEKRLENYARMGLDPYLETAEGN